MRFASIDRFVTLANGITLSRVCLVPPILISLVAGYPLRSLLLYSLALSSDFVDGRIARRTGNETRFGAALDPLCDAVLVFSLQIYLALTDRWPGYLIVISVMSMLSFVYRTIRAGISCDGIGKYVGAALMAGLFIRLGSVTFAIHYWDIACAIVFPVIAGYISISMLDNLLGIRSKYEIYR